VELGPDSTSKLLSYPTMKKLMRYASAPEGCIHDPAVKLGQVQWIGNEWPLEQLSLHVCSASCLKEEPTAAVSTFKAAPRHGLARAW